MNEIKSIKGSDTALADSSSRMEDPGPYIPRKVCAMAPNFPSGEGVSQGHAFKVAMETLEMPWGGSEVPRDCHCGTRSHVGARAGEA